MIAPRRIDFAIANKMLGPVRSSPSLQLPSDRDSSGRDLAAPELEEIERVIRSGTLICTSGRAVRELEASFATAVQRPFAVACSSGSAAVHAAIATIGLQPGDEIVTSPITDMGALLPLLYEGGLPRFCDVDPLTLAMTAATVAKVLSARTRAIIVTHLFGRPAPVGEIAALARERGLVLIEDCAQAFLAADRDGPVGTFGALACYSFQQGKHMTTGEGGMVTAGDAETADRVRRFVNKGWGYGDANPDHDRPGLNYRLTELQGAVGLAQLRKLPGVVARRRHAAHRLTAALAEIPGVTPMAEAPGTRCSYWRYCLHVDVDLPAGGPNRVATQLRSAGIASQPGYVGRPAYACGVFRNWRDHSVMRMPVQCAGLTDAPWAGLGEHDHPGVHQGLATVLVLPWNEAYTDDHVDAIAAAIRSAVGA